MRIDEGSPLRLLAHHHGIAIPHERSSHDHGDKGDSHAYEIRARLVAQEIRHVKGDAMFAATPPLEAVKLLLSLAARGRRLRQAFWADLGQAWWENQGSQRREENSHKVGPDRP